MSQRWERVKLADEQAHKIGRDESILETLSDATKLDCSCSLVITTVNEGKTYYLRGTKPNIQKLLNRLREGLRILTAAEVEENKKDRLWGLRERGERQADSRFENGPHEL